MYKLDHLPFQNADVLNLSLLILWKWAISKASGSTLKDLLSDPVFVLPVTTNLVLLYRNNIINTKIHT